MEWKVTTASIHDSIMAFPMMDSAYDSAGICDYFMDKTDAIPIIDTNTERGIVPDKLTFKRNRGIIIREREKARYRLRWEIERHFPFWRRYCTVSISGTSATGTMMLLLVKG